jgi:hypothetical protein
MATPKSAKAPKSPAKKSTADATEHVVKQLEELADSCKSLRRQVPSGAALSAADRRVSSGRFRSGEDAVLSTILDMVDARPGLFSVLAAHDGGADDAVVETSAARDALARKAAADAAVAAADLLAKALRDYALVTGEEVRALTSPAYGIIRANATVDASLRDDAAAVMAFYRDSSKPKTSKPKP